MLSDGPTNLRKRAVIFRPWCRRDADGRFSNGLRARLTLLTVESGHMRMFAIASAI
jgi:hypothetical protein